MLLPPRLDLREPRLHLRQGLCGPALHDVDPQGLQLAADDIDGGATRFLLRLGAIKMPLARGVEVARHHEAFAQLPVIQARSAHAWRRFASGLGRGASLGGRLLVEGQAGIGAACIPQRIGEIAEAGPARLALRGGLGGGFQVREQALQQARIAGAGDDVAREATQPVEAPA